MMALALSSQRALFGVRLVLRDYHNPAKITRKFSVAVLPNYPSRSPPTSSEGAIKGDTWNLRHASSDCFSPDFLEPSSAEYTSAGLTLPPRPTQATAHWATLYPSPSTPTSTLFHPPPRTRRCDTLAHLAVAGDLSVARTVYNELTALHIGIQRRGTYLPTALRSLDTSPAGKADFLFWLELVPNRPAVRSHPGVKAVWAPVIDRLLADFSTDGAFIRDFLYLSARKGILPTVMPRLMRHLALLTPLPESMGIMADLERVYVEGVTSRRSKSARAEAHAVFAQMRVADMRNAFVRVLAGAGWVGEAEEMMSSGEGWKEGTRAYVQARRDGLGMRPMTEISDKMVERVRQAGSGQMSPTNLANLMDELETSGRTQLVERLERRMEGVRDPTRREALYHARILLGRRKGWSNQAILEFFDQHFSWVGLPPPNISLPPSSSSTVKLTPSPAVFATLLPSLLSLVPSPLAYHSSYFSLSSTLPPRLRPTPALHANFIRQITHLLGPSAGLDALHSMVEAGLEPGLGVYEGILWSMAGTGEWWGLQGLLGGMEHGEKVGKGRMPRPEYKTYQGVVGILERAGMVSRAKEIVERAESRGLGVRNALLAAEKGIPRGGVDGEPKLSAKEAKRLYWERNKGLAGESEGQKVTAAEPDREEVEEEPRKVVSYA